MLDKIFMKVTIFISKLSDHIHFPWIRKRFNIYDYDAIHEKLESLDPPFAVILNQVYGESSNLLITLANLFSTNRRKIKSGITHATAFIGLRHGNKSRVLEAVGKGIQEVSLKNATCQKDRVVVLLPDYSKIPASVCKYANEFLNSLLDRDEVHNIDYDWEHDIHDPSTLDCSEAVYHALRYGYAKADIHCPIRLTKRFGRLTFAPVDIEFSELFIKWYDTKEGGFIS